MSEPDALPPGMAGYWMNETGPVLRPAVTAYLNCKPLALTEIAAIRAYLRQWVNADGWIGPGIAELRASVDAIASSADIDRWIEAAVDAGIDPL